MGRWSCCDAQSLIGVDPATPLRIEFVNALITTRLRGPNGAAVLGCLAASVALDRSTPPAQRNPGPQGW
jgi:hypothetical protein